MFQISLILVLVLGCACLLIIASALQCPEVPAYELRLNTWDPDVEKFISDGWNKLVDDGKTGRIKNMTRIWTYGALVQVIDNERRYTILVKYFIPDFNDSLYCYIFVWTNRSDPLFIDCYQVHKNELYRSEYQAQYDMYHFIYDKSIRVLPVSNNTV